MGFFDALNNIYLDSTRSPLQMILRSDPRYHLLKKSLFMIFFLKVWLSQNVLPGFFFVLRWWK